MIATQNPVDQEGTYPLPEAQVDRFMLKLLLDYPSREEELLIMDRMIEQPPADLQPILAQEHLLALQQLVPQVYLAPQIKEYILDLIFSTREPERFGHQIHSRGKDRPLRLYLEYGASPRATLALNLASRAHAMLQRRCYVLPDDVKAVAPDILRHRISLSYEAEADSLTADQILQQILNHLDVP